VVTSPHPTRELLMRGGSSGRGRGRGESRAEFGGGGGGGRGRGKYTNPCLTMHQPWASLLVYGIKRVEGRSWPAPLTGRLWIHAASKVPEPETIKAMENFYREIYAVAGVKDIKFPEHYPVSRLLGCVEVVGCVKCEELVCWEDVPESVRLEGQTDFCWLCENPQKLLIPFEMRGFQKVYNLERRIHDVAVRGLITIQGPLPVKFPLPDPQDPFSLRPGSLALHFSSSKAPEVAKTPNVSAAIAAARAAATQFSREDQIATSNSYQTNVTEKSEFGSAETSHAGTRKEGRRMPDSHNETQGLQALNYNQHTTHKERDENKRYPSEKTSRGSRSDPGASGKISSDDLSPSTRTVLVLKGSSFYPSSPMDASHVEPPPPPHSSASVTSFPVLAISILGILTTAMLLISYYVFVIKCRLGWPRSDLLRCLFSSAESRRHRHLYIPPVIHAIATEFHGLDPSVIRSIPVIKFTRAGDGDAQRKTSFHDCAICLNEFREEERLKLLPDCSHAFHIDCIDTWLQFNANCPLCRTGITSSSVGLATDHVVVLAPRREQSGSLAVDVRDEVSDQTSRGEASNPSLWKKRRKHNKVGSMGDECIDVRGKDEQFRVQPIRRSFSMDSSAERQLYLSVQEEILRQKQNCYEAGSGEGSSSNVRGGDGGGSGRVRRSLFSFGRSSRIPVLPRLLDV
ncbi:unnamed protein product, partial [Musa hybrid cultivar]